MEIADYVIVGAGSAGSVLAERLSACGRYRVLVLEAGGSDRRPWIRLPIGYGRTFHDPRVNWRFRATPDAGLNGREIYWPRGKVLGGSSSINGLVWHRGLAHDYDDWAAAGNAGWGWNDVAPAFERIERRIARDGSESGSGPQAVADRTSEYHPLRRHYLKAVAEAGLPRADATRAHWSEGAAPYRITTRRGLRCSAADAFLRPALDRPNLRVLKGAEVRRVIFEGRRAAGVAFARVGAVETVRARRAVIVAAGAVKSPQILQLSGIGPGALLSGMQIPVLHANDAVGGGLQDHVGIDYLFRATEPTLNQSLGTLRGQICAAWAWLTRRGGPLSLSVNQMGGLVRSTPDKARADTQLYFNPLSYSVMHRNRRELLRPDPWPGFILGFNTCRPTSRGRIDISAPDPAAPPAIAPNTLSTNGDVTEVLSAARLVARLLETEAMQGLIAGPGGFSPAGQDDDAVLADFRCRASTVFHPVGTCAMGPEGVVDARLRVRGVEGLRVADASVFPNITSANTNAPTMMLAWRAAEMILAEA